MDLYQPTSWAEALEIKATNPETVPILGGTDVMVQLNMDVARPASVLDLTRIKSLRELDQREAGSRRIAAGVTYSALIEQARGFAPALAIASRTVGSPQIRNRGTVGGNLGTASPAGDAHPPLVAVGATVEVESISGTRMIPIDDFYIGPKRSALKPNELIAAVWVPVAAGPQQFSKIGTRNAMVISVCSFAISVERETNGVGAAIGSAGPIPIRATDAQTFLSGVIESERRPSRAAFRRFGELVSEAARPIDDVRGAASYRRHALGVLAERCASWCLSA